MLRLQEPNMRDTDARNADLRQMLNERRSAIQDEVHVRLRKGRTDRPKEVRDDLEHSDVAMQGDIELALLQMRAATLVRIEEALVRLDAGKYGLCFECENEIPERRLRALPFAVRCQKCEGRRELEQGREQRLAQRRDGLTPFSNVSNAS
jgi:DnaK suppressor protein